jgi:hypothetical protein
MTRFNVRSTDGAIIYVSGDEYRWRHGDAGSVFLDIIGAGMVVASFLDPQHVADNNSVFVPKPPQSVARTGGA